MDLIRFPPTKRHIFGDAEGKDSLHLLRRKLTSKSLQRTKYNSTPTLRSTCQAHKASHYLLSSSVIGLSESCSSNYVLPVKFRLCRAGFKRANGSLFKGLSETATSHCVRKLSALRAKTLPSGCSGERFWLGSTGRLLDQQSSTFLLSKAAASKVHVALIPML